MRRLLRPLVGPLIAFMACGALAQVEDRLMLDAREASRKADAAALASLRDRAAQERHPLASWVDYWALGARLTEATQPELDAFYARWPGSYVEDRLRNDWLLELGKRRDWANFRREYLRFRMDDDREVRCYWLLTEHLDGQNVAVAAVDAWAAQTRDDEGCDLLARTLAEAGRLGPEAVWPVVRQAVEANRLRRARAAAALIGAAAARDLDALLDNPVRYLARQDRGTARGQRAELALLALLRTAARDGDVAVAQMQDWEQRLPRALAAYGWASIGRLAALRTQSAAADYYARALKFAGAEHGALDWPEDTIAWGARSALRGEGPPAARWQQLLRMVEAMTPAEQAEPVWVYWRARAQQALAPAGEAGQAEREAARAALQSIAGQLHFYGKLALEDLGGRLSLPARPAPLTAAERAAARATPGLQRALRLIEIGLRSEGVREWNFTLRDLQGDRALLAAAQWACEREVWDRCINTSDRTRDEVDMAQRFPTPFRDEVVAQARSIGLDPAYVYGLIRQESRFIMDARSGVGASGLMQIMPATARWTARKIGMDFKPSMITDRDVNLRLGTSYLKLVLDDFEGRMALGAAAYNAGPNRPRRWRDGPVVEAAAWVENIPFNETRDYVKKVLSNTALYGALIGDAAPLLKPRLGGPVGPRPAGAPAEDRELP
jgi:soluble lytic murein transglycosylase